MNSSIPHLASESAYTYHKVEPEYLPNIWLQIRPLIDKAMERSRREVNAEHFRRSLEKKQVDLFVAADGERIVMAMITQFVHHVNFTTFQVCTFAGLDKNCMETAIQEYWPTILKWAQSKGASRVEAICHVSMARLLQIKYGFKERYSLVSMKLYDEE